MADRSPKAAGMQWINPYLVVKDMKKSLEFYEKAFGLGTRMTIPDDKGNLVHAEMAHKDGIIMLGGESVEENMKAPSSMSGSSASLYLYVDNVEEAFSKAKTAGATTTEELKDQFWGDRTFQVKCPEGHIWTFAQNVADFDPTKA